jgi:membrane protease YdiL (CAAX protease family)
MSTPESGGGRFRADLQFIAAVVYFFLARSLARHGAQGLAGPEWAPLVDQAVLVFLLLLGYAVFGSWMDRQSRPVSAQGLPRRAGWPGEVGLGLAVGWAVALFCVLPMVVAGGIAIVLNLQPAAWGWLLADAAFFGLLALGEEIAFRGYGFQRFAHAVGSPGAALGFAAYYAIVQALTPGSNHASVAVSVVLSLVLSTAYLRTRALWLSWGLNFGWKASRALVFGLAVSGVSNHSPVVQGDPMGPFWLTGSGYGLDGTWIAFAVLLLAWPVVYRVTRELDFRYNAPVIVAGGIPVDLDAAARQQHEAAMGAVEPAGQAGPGLVQILPVATPLPAVPPNEPPIE